MAQGYALTIGLNSVDPTHYDGWNGKLNAPEKDAVDIQTLAKSVGFTTEILKGNIATREGVASAINNAAANLSSGDIFLLYYSGHGGQLPDLDGDEDDGRDETWCLFNGQMMDDEIRQFWTNFKEDVRVLVLSDSCHSGTVAKLLQEFDLNNRGNSPIIKNYRDCLPTEGIKAIPNSVALNTYMNNKAFYDKYITEVDKAKIAFKKGVDDDIKANIRLISGCQDNQSSYDGTFNSAFTEKLKTIWNGGKFKSDYSKFHSEIQNLLPPYQSPNHLVFGKQNFVYNSQIPFTI